MSFGIGVFGAQRVGKTTLAKHFAEMYGIQYLQVSASSVLERNGATAKADYDIQRRLELQRAILSDFCTKWEAACATDLPFITDRTPLDLYVYMLADVKRDCSANLAYSLQQYADDCLEAFVKYFDFAVLVQPGIKLVEDAKSAPAFTPFLTHFNLMALGLASRIQRVHVLNEDVLDLHARAEFVHSLCRK